MGVSFRILHKIRPVPFRMNLYWNSAPFDHIYVITRENLYAITTVITWRFSLILTKVRKAEEQLIWLFLDMFLTSCVLTLQIIPNCSQLPWIVILTKLVLNDNKNKSYIKCIECYYKPLTQIYVCLLLLGKISIMLSQL